MIPDKQTELDEALAPAVAARDVAARRGHLARSIAYFSAACVFVVGGTLLLVLLIQVKGTADNVESCITPRGECYERAVEESRNVEELQDDVDRLLVIVCADRPDVRECRP